MTEKEFIDYRIDKEYRKFKNDAWKQYSESGGYLEFGENQFKENCYLYPDALKEIKNKARLDYGKIKNVRNLR